MSTKLSLHWRPTHWDGVDQRIIAGWRPNSAKVINPSPDHVRCIRQASADTLIVLRDHPLSEQHDDMIRDPEGTGRRHADRLAQIVNETGADPDNTLVTGINEPHIWDPGGIMATVAYTVTLLDDLRRRGLRGGALNLAVGWPANDGLGTPPNWRLFAPVYDAIRRGGHVLVLHEYWAKQGPQYNWGWWAGRYTQCPWDVPVVIGECGLDQYVADPGSGESRGWASHLSAEQYFAQLRWYDEQLQRDPRVHSAQVFCYDYDAPWGTFDIRQVREQWLAAVTGWGRGNPGPLFEGALPFDDPPDAEEADPAAIREAAWNALGIPYNPEAALARYAREHELGNPMTPEFDVGGHRAQGFANGILYCRIGDWGNVKSIRW